jgi:hypothetical protein
MKRFTCGGGSWRPIETMVETWTVPLTTLRISCISLETCS